MTKSNSWIILAGMILLGFLIRAWFIFQPTIFWIHSLLADDAYYYFKMGENVAAGLGTTFDGIHLTNGYHPLWMGIVSLVYVFFRHLPQGSDEPIRSILFIASLVNVLTAIPIWFFLRRFHVSRLLPFLGVGLYLFNPWSIAHGLNGLETAVANAGLAVCAWFAVLVLEQPRNKAYIALLSIVAASTILGRIDYFIYVGILGFGMLFRLRRAWQWKEYVAALAPGLMILSMWFGFAALFLGGAIPQSGLASTLVNKTLFYYKERPIWHAPVWSVYQAWMATKLAASISGLSWLLWVGVGVLWLGMAWSSFKRRAWEHAEIVLFCLSLGILGQITLHGGMRWFARDWYFSFGVILAVFVLAWIAKIRPMSTKAIGVLLVMIVCAFWATNPFSRPYFASQAEMYQAAIEMRKFIPDANARVGAFNAGIYGYYSGFTVLNLDGLVNGSAYEALRDRRLKEYFREKQIQYVLDYDISWQYRYRPFFGTSHFSFFQPIHVFKESSLYHGSTLVLYKIAL